MAVCNIKGVVHYDTSLSAKTLISVFHRDLVVNIRVMNRKVTAIVVAFFDVAFNQFFISVYFIHLFKHNQKHNEKYKRFRNDEVYHVDSN